LLDFGGGRKLERFGPVVLDRPSPAAADARLDNERVWDRAAARFVPVDGSTSVGCGPKGVWTPRVPAPADWIVEHAPLRFELRRCDSGHVGLFPEQVDNWDWIARQVSATRAQDADVRPRVLNLFAYTGASTLAAAAAGAEVVHVDAAKGTVAWARRNAALSGLSEAPIRWIPEDARRFVAREQKRGNRYQGIILDPPSYGHGPAGQAWQIDRHLPDLLAACGRLLTEETGFLLLTCHSPDIGPAELSRHLREAVTAGRASDASNIDAHDLFLTTDDGRQLHSGVAARWSL
jgi:23S rRNA (cytosine1962-C5)-methyltransferase